MSTPVFKKKSARGMRRKRPEIDMDDSGGASVFGVVKNFEVKPQNALKWARYASLVASGDNASEPRDGKCSNGPAGTSAGEVSLHRVGTQLAGEGGEDLPQVMDDIVPHRTADDWVTESPGARDAALDNLAYKIFTLDNLKDHVQSGAGTSDTFSLKELYFRDAHKDAVPLDKEYADAYGNVSDEDSSRAAQRNVPEDEDEVELLDDYFKSAMPHSELYDQYLSVDSDSLDEDSSKLRDPESVRGDLVLRIERLESSVKVRSECLLRLELSLKDVQERRVSVLQKLLDL